jgi:hypothetical protein
MIVAPYQAFKVRQGCRFIQVQTHGGSCVTVFPTSDESVFTPVFDVLNWASGGSNGAA